MNEELDKDIEQEEIAKDLIKKNRQVDKGESAYHDDIFNVLIKTYNRRKEHRTHHVIIGHDELMIIEWDNRWSYRVVDLEYVVI